MELLELHNLSELPIVADKFLYATKGKKVFAFFGPMGAGKTTFIKALCNELGVVDVVTSPTFSLVNEYSTNRQEVLYHFDFYRIENLEEVYDMGYEEYFYSGNICFIEWPDKVAELLPEDVVFVNIDVQHNGKRIIKIK